MDDIVAYCDHCGSPMTASEVEDYGTLCESCYYEEYCEEYYNEDYCEEYYND